MAAARFGVQYPITLRLQAPNTTITATSLNLSETGICLDLPQKMPFFRGQIILFTLHLSNQPANERESIPLCARVAWQKNTRIGIQLRPSSESANRSYLNLISAFEFLAGHEPCATLEIE